MKPQKWGIKGWTRRGASDFLYDFDIYLDNDLDKQPDTDICQECGKVGAVDQKLAVTLPKHVGHFYMGNLFLSINLYIHFFLKVFFLVGSIRNNQMYIVEMLIMLNQK